MLNKVFKYTEHRGRFGGIDYLMGDKARAEKPELLRGNEAITRQLLSTAKGAKAYTTGVCSFKELAKDVSLDVQNEIMDLYEKTIMAGFPPDHYDMIWIRHTDKNGRLELNWHIVNQDLQTGRVLKPYFHKQDQYRIDLAKKIINDKYGFHSPDDPENRRDFTSENNFGCRKEAQDKINEYVAYAIENGLVDNQNDVKDFLDSLEDIEVTRVTKKGISIKITNNDEIKKTIRFTGLAFSKEFNGLESTVEAKKQLADEFNKQRNKRLRENIKKLERANREITEVRKPLLVSIEDNRRNKFSFVDNDNSDNESRIESKRNSQRRSGDNENTKQLDSKVHETISDNTASDFDINDDWIHSGEVLLKEKKETLEELKNYNNEHIRNTERRREEVIRIPRQQSPRAKNLFTNFIKFIREISKRNEAERSLFIEAARTRKEQQQTFVSRTQECHAACQRLVQLLRGSNGTLDTVLAEKVSAERVATPSVTPKTSRRFP